jgi:hypothetical protein
MIENLRQNTGKSIDEWVQVAAGCGGSRHGEIVARLKSEHGLTHGYANLVAHRLLKSAAGDAAPGDLVAAQYAGAKAALKPIYQAVLAAVTALGSDVEVAPKKAYVSLRRSKQFAIIQPSTAARVDIGINLKGVAPRGRLEASGSFNAMVSHRVRVESLNQVDKELVAWLKQAYETA